MHKAIASSLHDGEQVIHEVRQNFWSNFFSFPVFFLISIVFLCSFLLVQYFISLSITSGIHSTCAVNGVEQPIEMCYVFFKKFMSLTIIPVIALLAIQAYVWVLPLVTEYVVTTKRVIFKSGLIGADIRSVFYNQIRAVTVKVGIVDKMFGTGVVQIDSGDQTLEELKPNAHLTQFSHIDHPYEIAKIIQERYTSE